MNDEIKEIIEIFKNITNDYSTNSIFDFEDYEITCLQVKSLLDYITNLQEELQAYKQERENILDKSKRLNYKLRIDKAIKQLQNQLQQKENIIKEVREYIENNKQYAELEDYGKNGEYYIDEIGLLQILDKVGDNNE